MPTQECITTIAETAPIATEGGFASLDEFRSTDSEVRILWFEVIDGPAKYGIWSEDRSFAIYYDSIGVVYRNGETRAAPLGSAGDVVTVVIANNLVGIYLNGVLI